jgi:very-short-patch-repair endonuclease
VSGYLNVKIGINYTNEEIPSLILELKNLLELRTISLWVNEFKNSNLPEVLSKKVLTGHASDVQKFLSDFQYKIGRIHIDVEETIKKLIEFGTFDKIQFYGSVSPSFKSIQKKHEEVAKHLGMMKEWIDYSRAASDIKQFNLKWIIDAIRKKEIEPQKALQAFHYAYYKTLSLHIMRDNHELGGFSRQNHEQKIEQFKKLDIELLKLNQQLVAANAANVSYPSGIQNGKVGEFTEMGLLKNEIRKKTRHISLRSALVRAPNSIQAIKPCFMMSPMSCAQYLAPGLIEFDLIVMDEASQIRPEDALGSLARAKQIVVVGDPKQLPPTSFFDRKFEDNDDDEDQSIVDDSESILDLCLKAFSRPRRLSWHYRSQHESLIAFSNNLFYGGNEGRGLMLFPSPREAGNEYGIKRHYIEHGRFINKYNIPEADAIVHAVIQHFSSWKSESLGIVTMNALQAQYIMGLLDDARKKDPMLDKAMQQHGENDDSFFVKNLENVQGDERDVIFISTTYGPDQTGIQHQRFGPINSEHGWRRLNVLITRAKKRIELFTSMLSTNIIPTPKSHLGVISLKGYLKYTETNFLEPAHTNNHGRTAMPDSPFEEAVANIIKMAGYEVELQVGAAGYFIDIAVKHPDNPHEYLLAVECDGSTYHSSKSARDRDRLREAVLRKMGWEVHRIWSTDWFNHRTTEISRLISIIEKMRKAHPVTIKQVIVKNRLNTK